MPDILLEDESLRDGLQFEQQILPLDAKIALFQLLRDAGLKRIQVGSFVNPRIVPQMADTHEFIQAVKDSDVLLTGLVLNPKGLDRAIASGLTHVSLSASASDAHSRKNVGKSSPEATAAILSLISDAKMAGLMVRAGIQCAFGCVYEGAIDVDRVIDMLSRMSDAGADEINLADTTGMAHPCQVTRLVERIRQAQPGATLSLHLHDTRGLGIANMVAGYASGVRIFDTSAGGLGGCPFVKGAAGNVPTEDAVHLFTAMGVTTGIDLKKICKVADRFRELLGRELPGRMGRVLEAMEQCAREQHTT